MSTALQGGYRTSFRGSGLIFSDIREYQPGDDGKRIHWAATARRAAALSGSALVKSYEEERSLSIMMLVDSSRSMSGSVTATNPQYLGDRLLSSRAQTFGELVVSLAMLHRDAVGLCLCSSRVEEYRKPAASRSQSYTLLDRLSATFLSPSSSASAPPPSSGRFFPRSQEPLMATDSTDLRPGIEAILAHQRRGGVVFILSDFFAPPFEPALRRLTHRHDTVCVYLRHPFFTEVPSVGVVAFRDVESGQPVLIDTSSGRSRRALQQSLIDHHNQIVDQCARCRADLITIDADPVAPFLSFLRDRTARVR